MRIRSIKPEFWRSDDITSLPLQTRLTFIGLWSYVDDNGVGADKLVSIVADLYADDFSNDPQETLMRVSEDLQRLSMGGQVIRFRADHNGAPKELLYITKWKAHQKIQHPSLGHKYPVPPAEMIKSHETLMSTSVDPHESLTHEQGNRGTGEQGRGSKERGAGDDDPGPPEPPPGPYDTPSETVVVVEPPIRIDANSTPAKRHPTSAAKTLVRQTLGSDYPRVTVDRLAIQVDKLSHEGHPDTLIRDSVAEWDRRPNCDRPEFLPTVLGDLVKRSRAAPAVNGHDAKVNDFLAFANRPTNLEIES